MVRTCRPSGHHHGPDVVGVADGLRGVFPARYAVVSSLSYVTGSHSAKAGLQYIFGQEKNTTDFNADLVQRYRSGASRLRDRAQHTD